MLCKLQISIRKLSSSSSTREFIKCASIYFAPSGPWGKSELRVWSEIKFCWIIQRTPSSHLVIPSYRWFWTYWRYAKLRKWHPSPVDRLYAVPPGGRAVIEACRHGTACLAFRTNNTSRQNWQILMLVDHLKWIEWILEVAFCKLW